MVDKHVLYPVRDGNEDDDLFVPAIWNEQVIVACSRLGYTDKVWLLPDDWHGVECVETYSISLEGCEPIEGCAGNRWKTMSDVG